MAETTEPTEDRYAEFAQNTYANQARKVAEHLRELADRIDREPVRAKIAVSGGDGKPDHSWHASMVVHEIQWGLANINLSRLIEAAAEADRAVRA